MIYYFFYLLKPLIWLIFRPKVYGNRKALATKGGAIFICNHISMADPVLLGIVSPRIIHFMAKKEIFANPILRGFFKACFAFPVSRGTADLKSIKNAIKVLEKGGVFGIFPEGRRMVADCMDEFELGTSMIAIRTGVPVVPIYMHVRAYKMSRPKLIVGEPIYPAESHLDGASRRENEQIFTQRIMNRMNALKRELDDICGS